MLFHFLVPIFPRSHVTLYSLGQIFADPSLWFRTLRTAQAYIILRFTTMHDTTRFSSLSIDQEPFSSSENGSAEISLDVKFTTAVILVTLASFLFFLACIIVFIYYKWRLCRHIVETRIGLVVFFLGALLTVVTTLSCYTEQEVYAVYRLTLLVCCGIGVLVVGSAILFENASPERPLDDYGYERLPVGYMHGSMGMIIWVVTIPLSILELFFAIGASRKAPNTTYAAVRYTALVQKIVQASVYYFSLRHKVARGDMRMACSWLLKIMSVFNFAFWIDSVVTSNSDNDFVNDLFGNGFSIVKSAYNALLIDFRLLCCLLFLEHSLELMEVRINRRIGEIFDPEASEALIQDSIATVVVNVEISHSSGYGYVIGLILIATQLVEGLQYLGFVGRWTNMFPMLASVVVIIFGLLLLYGNTSMIENDDQFDYERSKWRETESRAIDVMVCFMGTIGFIFWFMKASYCGLWASQYSSTANSEIHQYLTWTTVKDFTFSITILFQLYFFVKMGPHFGCDRESSRQKAKHFYVTTIMMALFSLLISFVIDNYNGRVEKLLAQAHISNTMSIFFQAAVPIQLGFSLHMFLHFFIMNRRLSQFQYNWKQQSENLQHRHQSSIGNTGGNNTVSSAETGDERQPLISRPLSSMPQS